MKIGRSVTDKGLDYDKIDKSRHLVIPLIKTNVRSQSDLLYFEGVVNGEKAIIYLDTGSTKSFVDLEEKNNNKGNNTATVNIGNREYKFSHLRSETIKHSGDFQYPIKFALNSDTLKSNGFIITIDKIENKLIFH